MKFERNTHLHSREHLLADDLATMMREPKRFASYLGVARMYHEDELRTLAKRVLEKRDLDPNARGRYFFGALRSMARRTDWKAVPRKPKSQKEKPKKHKPKISKEHV